MRVVVSVVVLGLALGALGAPAYAKKKHKQQVFQVSPLASSCGYSGSTLAAVAPASPLVRMRRQWVKRYRSQYIRVTATLEGSNGSTWTAVKGAKKSKIFKVKRKWAKKWKTAPALPPFTGMSGYAQYRVKLQAIWYRPSDARVDKRAKGYITSYSHGSTCPATYTPPVAPVAVDVAAGDYHTCARMSDATLRCWGLGNNGRLGTGNTNKQVWPVTVPGLSGVRSLAVGQSHTCAVTTANVAYCWGYNAYGQLGTGQLGAGTDRLSPTPVVSLAGAGTIWSNYNTTCATSSGQPLKCWGRNDYGQLDNGKQVDLATPVAIAGLTSMNDTGTGSQFVCSLRSTGLVYCWGRNQVGQLGNGSTTAASDPGVRRSPAVTGVTAASAIATGDAHACAIVANGAVQCWGYNNYGQLGDNSTTNRPSAVTVKNLGGASALSAGYDNTCAIASGQVRCWGNNTYGQLGLGNTTTYTTPQTVPGLSGMVGVTVGIATVCAWNGAGQVWCWGRNTYGELGRGTTSSYETRPALVGGL